MNTKWSWMLILGFVAAGCGGDDRSVPDDTDISDTSDASDASDTEQDAAPDVGPDAVADTGPEPECLAAFTCGVSEPRPSILVEPPRFRAVPIPVAPEIVWNSAAHDVNDSGEMTGAIRYEDDAPQAGRTSPFRFSEAGGFQEIRVGGGGQGLAINASGEVTGYAYDMGEMRAFVSTGASGEFIGRQFTGGESHGSDINDDGVVVGFCQDQSNQRPCVYTPGEGWNTLDIYGSARGITADGTVYGLSPSATSNVFRWTKAGGMQDIGVSEVHLSFPEAVSGNGKHLALERGNRRIVDMGDAMVLNLEGGAPIALDDPDGQPLRKLESRIWDINNDGWAVGQSLDEMGRPVGWLYDPRSGQTHDLHDLVELPPGRWSLKQAHGISNTGFIAATAGLSAEEPENFAMLLVPQDWPDAPDEELPAESNQQTMYTAIWAPAEETPNPRLKNSSAVGVTDDARLAIVADDYDSTYRAAFERPAWLDASGVFTAYGEFVSDLPVHVTGGGRLSGTAMVIEEFTDVRRYFAATSTGEALEPLGVLEGYLDSFGYGANESGQVLAECLGEPGMKACLHDPQTGWRGLFDGQAFALSETGVVTGATDEDGLVFEAGVAQPLGLGAGTRPYTISRNGRFVAGVSGHAFIYDRQLDLLDWLPDLYGDPATVGHVQPRAVTDTGLVVGIAYDVTGEKYAFRYDSEVGKMDRLEELVEGDVRLREAVGVNASGWIAATALMPNGTTRALMLQPVDLE